MPSVGLVLVLHFYFCLLLLCLPYCYLMPALLLSFAVFLFCFVFLVHCFTIVLFVVFILGKHFGSTTVVFKRAIQIKLT